MHHTTTGDDYNIVLYADPPGPAGENLVGTVTIGVNSGGQPDGAVRFKHDVTVNTYSQTVAASLAQTFNMKAIANNLAGSFNNKYRFLSFA